MNRLLLSSITATILVMVPLTSPASAGVKLNALSANGNEMNALSANGTDVTGSVAIDPRFSAETQLFDFNAAQPLEVILPGDVGTEKPATLKQGGR